METVLTYLVTLCLYGSFYLIGRTKNLPRTFRTIGTEVVPLSLDISRVYLPAISRSTSEINERSGSKEILVIALTMIN